MKANELKVTELMIGDWVICYHPTRLKCFEKVSVGLLHTMQEQEYGYIKENSPLFRIVEPIPITKELLEKNGFTVESSSSRMLFHHDNYRLCYYFNSSNRFSSFNMIDGSLVQKVIVNVHELQHALKLCRIDKEIVL